MQSLKDQKPNTAGVGNEKSYDKGALENKRMPNRSGTNQSEVKRAEQSGDNGMGKGCCVGDTSMKGAVAELHKQHPIKYDDLGPHHGKHK